MLVVKAMINTLIIVLDLSNDRLFHYDLARLGYVGIVPDEVNLTLGNRGKVVNVRTNLLLEVRDQTLVQRPFVIEEHVVLETGPLIGRDGDVLDVVLLQLNWHFHSEHRDVVLVALDQRQRAAKLPEDHGAACQAQANALILYQLNVLFDSQLQERYEQVLLALLVDAQTRIDDLDRQHLVELDLLAFFVIVYALFLLNLLHLLVERRELIKLEYEDEVATFALVVFDAVLD